MNWLLLLNWKTGARKGSSMHTYLLRLLIAAITFTVGVAVSFIPFFHSSKVQQFSYERRHKCWKRASSQPTVGVQQDASEPLRLTYLSAGDDAQTVDSSTVRLLVQNFSGRDVRNFSINWVSRYRYSRAGGGGAVQSGVTSGGSILHDGESTTINLDASTDQLTWAWLSSVDFTDGSRWLR